MQYKFYLKFAYMPFDEDQTNEFKGHRLLSIEDLPFRCKVENDLAQTKCKPISRNLCAFLNTELGGTVYCGVNDNGQITGLKLTQYQRDHVSGALADLFSRYTPKVTSDKYKLRFVPVLLPNTKEKDRDELAMLTAKVCHDGDLTRVPHLFRSPDNCWCEKDCWAQIDLGIVISEYIIEINIKSWDYDDPKNEGIGAVVNAFPIYSNEEGRTDFRRQGSTTRYQFDEVANIAYFVANARCHQVIANLRREIELTKSSIASKLRTKEKNIVGSTKKEDHTEIDGSTKTGDHKEMNESTKLEDHKEIDGSTQTEDDREIDVSTKLEDHNEINESTKLEDLKEINGSTKPEYYKVIDGSTQTEKDHTKIDGFSKPESHKEMNESIKPEDHKEMNESIKPEDHKEINGSTKPEESKDLDRFTKTEDFKETNGSRWDKCLSVQQMN